MYAKMTEFNSALDEVYTKQELLGKIFSDNQIDNSAVRVIAENLLANASLIYLGFAG